MGVAGGVGHAGVCGTLGKKWVWGMQGDVLLFGVGWGGVMQGNVMLQGAGGDAGWRGAAVAVVL